MLSQPISDDRALSQSLYQALIAALVLLPVPPESKPFLLLPLLCWRQKSYYWILIKLLNKCKP